MAAPQLLQPTQDSTTEAPRFTSIKSLSESPDLTSIPSLFTFTTNTHDNQPSNNSDPEESIPVIDFSILTSGTPHERSRIIHDLGKACQDWGFFMVINHGLPESMVKEMIDACGGFFNLTEEEKQEYKGKHVLDPIRCGTSFNASVEKVLFWRDFVKFFVHPIFHAPDKPVGFRGMAMEYSKRLREIESELLRGISESLGLEDNYINKAMNVANGLQILVANLYPPCPQPEMAMGLPPHSDHGFLTILTQNGVGGLQLQRKGMWVDVNAIHNSLSIIIGDQMEILSNGKYKSVVHRAVVNNRRTRISIAMAHGPAVDTVVGPAPELLQRERQRVAYVGMKYKDYVELQQSNKLDGKSCLDRVRIQEP